MIGNQLKPTHRPAQDIDNLATFDEKLGEIPDGAVYIKGNVIQWVGTTVDLPEELKSADQIFSLKDRVMIPGMVTEPTLNHNCAPSHSGDEPQIPQITLY